MIKRKKEKFTINEFLNYDFKKEENINIKMIAPGLLVSPDLPLGGPFVTVAVVSVGLIIVAAVDKNLEDLGYESSFITKALICSSLIGVVYFVLKNYSTFLILFYGG